MKSCAERENICSRSSWDFKPTASKKRLKEAAGSRDILVVVCSCYCYYCCYFTVKMQVVYGRSTSDEFDRQGLSAMIDYWISPAAVKREFEATKSKYLQKLDKSHPF